MTKIRKVKLKKKTHVTRADLLRELHVSIDWKSLAHDIAPTFHTWSEKQKGLNGRRLFSRSIRLDRMLRAYMLMEIYSLKSEDLECELFDSFSMRAFYGNRSRSIRNKPHFLSGFIAIPIPSCEQLDAFKRFMNRSKVKIGKRTLLAKSEYRNYVRKGLKNARLGSIRVGKILEPTAKKSTSRKKQTTKRAA